MKLLSWKYRDKILDGRKECLHVSRCSIIARANNLFYLDLYEIIIIMDIVISANYTFFFQFLQCNLLIDVIFDRLERPLNF